MLYIIVTIDVENPQTPLRRGLIRDNLIDPTINGELWGTSRLSQIFKSNDIPAVFFLATNEQSLWGKPFFSFLAKKLDESGHEVGIHSHPEWDDLPRRVHMWEYTLDEQRKILGKMSSDITIGNDSIPSIL